MAHIERDCMRNKALLDRMREEEEEEVILKKLKELNLSPLPLTYIQARTDMYGLDVLNGL